MNKLYLMRNPEIFQGESYLVSGKSYFEGWYFKNTMKKETISFIPGVSITGDVKKAFIQVITNNKSYFISYPLEEFEFSMKPFYIRVGNNFFSKNRIRLDIEDEIENIKIEGDLNYSNVISIETNVLNPNIMGPFSYIPFMECNHAILSMKNEVNGKLKINQKKFIFDKGIGYIEKDWGTSFPKSYIWAQGNCFQKQNASFMISIANVPFKIFSFTGIICVLIVEGVEYKFTTYNHAKLIKCNVDENNIHIVLNKGDYTLDVSSSKDSSQKLLAPVKGRMNKDILESVSANLVVTLRLKDEVLFLDTSTNCGLEIVEK